MDDLLSRALSVAEILIIKRDFDLLIKIATQLPAEIQTQLTPYTALFCYESIEYLKKKGQNIDIQQTSRYSIKDIRQKAKFFDFRVNKLLQSIDNIDCLQNDYFIGLMRYPELGSWNLHDNLGITFDDEKNIVGNTHYAYYVFQDDKSISKPHEKMSGHEIIGTEVRDFACDMGRIIGSISSALNCIGDFVVADFDSSKISLHTQDFNTNRCTTAGNEKYKTIRLFLLHVLSSIGLVLFILKKAIIRESGLLLKFEYITYHYALLRLDGLAHLCASKPEVFSDTKLVSLLNSIDYQNENNLRKTEFRNCIMHFALTDKLGNSLIAGDKFDPSIPLCGLVESQFNMSYSEYKSKLEKQLLSIYQQIKEYLAFNLSLD